VPPLPHTGERGARVLARGAQHHESERAACKQASTEQQRGHAEDARDGWLRGQERVFPLDFAKNNNQRKMGGGTSGHLDPPRPHW
jgi:hypothetical protein